MKKIAFMLSFLFLFIFISCETTEGYSSTYNTGSTESDPDAFRSSIFYKTDIDEFYKVLVKTSEIPTECKLAQDEEPKIYYTSDFSSDLYFLQSNYYYAIGYAGWNGAAESVNKIEKNAEKLCKRYGAKVALYSYEYTDTRSGWTTYGSYSIKRYDCSIYLFVPYPQSYIQMPKVGIEWRDLNASDRLEAQRNTGAYISIVYEKSPAFYANLTKGDILIEMNGVPILDSESVHLATRFVTAGNIVTLKYLRNGVEKEAAFTVY